MISLEINDVVRLYKTFQQLTSLKGEYYCPIIGDNPYPKHKHLLRSIKTVKPMYLRDNRKHPRYMGGAALELLEHLSDFSTFYISYPQYWGSYPQCWGAELQCFCNHVPIFRLA